MLSADVLGDGEDGVLITVVLPFLRATKAAFAVADDGARTDAAVLVVPLAAVVGLVPGTTITLRAARSLGCAPAGRSE